MREVEYQAATWLMAGEGEGAMKMYLLQIVNSQLQFLNCKSQFEKCKLQFMNCKWKIQNCKLQPD